MNIAYTYISPPTVPAAGEDVSPTLAPPAVPARKVEGLGVEEENREEEEENGGEEEKREEQEKEGGERALQRVWQRCSKRSPASPGLKSKEKKRKKHCWKVIR